MRDIYYTPEEFGLTVVASTDFSDGSYQFDLRIIWRHEDGRLLTARDAGCSCPSPFEDYNCIEQLDPVDFEELMREAQEVEVGTWGWSLSDKMDWLSKLAELRSSAR